MAQTKELLQRTAEHTQNYLDSANSRPVKQTATNDQLRQQLAVPLSDQGEAPLKVIDSLAETARTGTVASQGPRYFGFVVGSSLPVATAADWLVSGWDQNAGLYVLSPFNSTVENVVNDWLRDIANVPQSWSVGYVTGGSMANFTALAAARHHLLQAAGWDVEANGLFGAPPIEVIANEEAHYSISTSFRMLGIGDKRIHWVPTDKQGRMQPGELEKVLKMIADPCIVCAQAGNVNTGSFDPVDAISATIARYKNETWLHVDGAFGFWAAASSSHKHLVAGLEKADSISTDAHKWLNVPYDCGITMCANTEAHRRAMTLAADYIEATPDERDPHEYTPEESRRARAIPVYAALRTLGKNGINDLVDRCCRHARRFADGLREAGYEVLNDVVLNQVLVSFGKPETTRRIISEIQNDGTCWCGGTKWKGQVAMRISVSSWATTKEDVERSLEAMIRVARSVKKEV